MKKVENECAGCTDSGMPCSGGFRSMNKWTPEEISTLQRNYNKVSNDELIKLLPNKTFTAIYKKAYRMGMRKSKENEFVNRSNARKGEKCCNWKGGFSSTSKGYKLIKKPDLFPEQEPYSLVVLKRYTLVPFQYMDYLPMSEWMLRSDRLPEDHHSTSILV